MCLREHKYLCFKTETRQCFVILSHIIYFKLGKDKQDFDYDIELYLRDNKVVYIDYKYNEDNYEEIKKTLTTFAWIE